MFDYDYGGGHIYNLGTQVTWRTRAEIEYIEGSLDRMLYLAVCNDVKAIAMPAIGAGLGGLKWDDVKRCIERVASSIPWLIYMWLRLTRGRMSNRLHN